MLDLVLVQLPNPALANTMYNSLGILSLASVVEAEGYSVYIVDMRNENRPLPKAKFYGFSCTTPEINYAKEIAKRVKGKTIVGGGHPSALPEDCLGHFNYVVMGEGEEKILKIISGELSQGVSYGARIKDLNKIPYPSRHLIKYPYNDQIFEGERYGHGAKTATMITTRGCPYNCSYCANQFRSITSRSVENVIGEMELVLKDGVTHFKFMDDCFTLHPEFERLCNEIKKLNVSYIAHTRSDLMTPKIAKLLKIGGMVFVETHFSFSSHERPWHFFQFSDMALRVLFSTALGIECVDTHGLTPVALKI